MKLKQGVRLSFSGSHGTRELLEVAKPSQENYQEERRIPSLIAG